MGMKLFPSILISFKYQANTEASAHLPGWFKPGHLIWDALKFLDIHKYPPKIFVPFQTTRKTHTGYPVLWKTADMYANKPEIISELVRLGLFPAKPEVETDLRGQVEIHHWSVGFRGTGIKFFHIALFIYTSASFQVKYPRMNKR